MENIEQRFKAAVNVLRGLSKSGSYQLSTLMMLRFYSYFKIATLGPCTQRKPPFWDVVGRAKYDSYKGLGKMSKERAMELFVEELKKIIETMCESSDTIMGSVSELNGIDIADLEAVAPEAMKNVCSHPNSPLASREASPLRPSHQTGNDATEPLDNGNNQFPSGHSTEHSDDEYFEISEDDTYLCSLSTQPTARRSAQQVTSSTPTHNQQIDPAISQILCTVELMSKDLQAVNRHIETAECSKICLDKLKPVVVRYPRWWPFTNISPAWFLFMLLWPFLAQRLGKMFRSSRLLWPLGK